MKIGFSSLVGVEPTPLPELLAWSAANGFDTIQLNTGPSYGPIDGAAFPGHLDIGAVLRDGPAATHELLADHGLTISALAPMTNLLSADPALRETRVALMRRTIDAAAALGVDTVVTFCGSAHGMHFWGTPGVGDGHPSNRVADNLRIFTEVYGPIADHAESRGVRIAFETAGRGGPEGNLAHSPELWDAMFEAVPSSALGLSFDPSHLVWLQIPNIPEVIRTYRDRIYNVDGKDTEILPARLARQGILGSGWWRYRLPGLGALDWRAILATLTEVGYHGALAIENEDPIFPGRDGVKWAADYLRAQLPPSNVHAATRPVI
jgi:sugar phosphate isomerase/epimerase